MAILIDRVYRTVQNIINKDQRGFLTPEEFNNLANQAQVEIFENYFGDYNFLENAKKRGRTNNEHADSPKHFRERINLLTAVATAVGVSGIFPLPENLYRLTNITVNGSNAEEEEHDALQYSQLARGSAATTARPVYTRAGSNVTIYPNTITDISVNYIRELNAPKWTYQNINNTPLFLMRDDFQDFEIHPAEEPELVAKILGYTGIVIREAELVQAANALMQTDAQNEAKI